jgi:hypothetical protein
MQGKVGKARLPGTEEEKPKSFPTATLLDLDFWDSYFKSRSTFL